MSGRMIPERPLFSSRATGDPATPYRCTLDGVTRVIFAASNLVARQLMYARMHSVGNPGQSFPAASTVTDEEASLVEAVEITEEEVLGEKEEGAEAPVDAPDADDFPAVES